MTNSRYSSIWNTKFTHQLFFWYRLDILSCNIILTFLQRKYGLKIDQIHNYSKYIFDQKSNI